MHTSPLPAFQPRYRLDDEVVPGVKWGHSGLVPSPAFWAALAAEADLATDAYICPRGTPLIHEVVFCILGGFGIRMEVNQAAWVALEKAGLLRGELTTRRKIEDVLRHPLDVGGRKVRYRFPKQRAHRVAIALRTLGASPPPTDCISKFRQALMALPGIGPKTASWIARNWLGSNDVAILDIHVLRAGCIMGLFPESYRLPRDYEFLERRFLAFARAIDVPAALLDALIWREMRTLSPAT